MSHVGPTVPWPAGVPAAVAVLGADEHVAALVVPVVLAELGDQAEDPRALEAVHVVVVMQAAHAATATAAASPTTAAAAGAGPSPGSAPLGLFDTEKCCASHAAPSRSALSIGPLSDLA